MEQFRLLLGIMPTERCVKWEPVQQIQSACADISLSLDSHDRLAVTMHFSFMVGQPKRDLLLTFSGPISIRWEQESFGLNLLPKPWPKIDAGDHPTWTFPLLQIENSAWLAAHENTNPPAAARRLHFALLSLNDLVQILALPEVAATWIDTPLTSNPAMQRTAD